MTGFGRAEIFLTPSGRAVIEIRSLNHRFLEVECRLPQGLEGLEDSIRQLLRRSLRRGRVRVSVTVKDDRVASAAGFHADVARRYVTGLRKLARELKVPAEISLPLLLSLPQVVTAPEPGLLPSRWARRLDLALREALGRLTTMRQKEGKRLARALAQQIGQMERSGAWIKRRLPKVQRAQARRFSARLRRMAAGLDPRATAAQAASWVEAHDVTEELTRMSSHLAALRQAVEGRVKNPGRTLDFLAQELHREVNTLGSKAPEAAMVRRAVDMKNQIEKIKEQAANVE